MDPESSTTYLFSEVANLFRTDFERAMNTLGLHGGEIFILRTFFVYYGQNQINLALKLHFSAPTINNMVKSLSKNSFVKCRRCDVDGRVMRVYLTKKAFDLKSQIAQKWQEFEKMFFSPLNETEILILCQLFEKLKSRDAQ